MTTIAPTSAAADPAPAEDREVTGGVDTHDQSHTAAAIGAAGRLLGHATFATTPAGASATSPPCAGSMPSARA